MASKNTRRAALMAAAAGLLFSTGSALAGEVRSGTASTYGNGYEGFLALPEGPGHTVRVCGPAACIIRTSNDAGPSLAMQRKGRIIDLDATDFNEVCGCQWQNVGLVKVTVEYLDGGATLPPTSSLDVPVIPDSPVGRRIFLLPI